MIVIIDTSDGGCYTSTMFGGAIRTLLATNGTPSSNEIVVRVVVRVVVAVVITTARQRTCKVTVKITTCSWCAWEQSSSLDVFGVSGNEFCRGKRHLCEVVVRFCRGWLEDCAA